MTCQQIVKTDFDKIAEVRSFDGDFGKIGIVGGDKCWKDIVSSLTEADKFVRKQLAEYEKDGVDLNAISLPTLEEYEAMVNEIPDYTDGKIMIARWEWLAKDVSEGSDVGLCVGQDGSTSTSCWGFTKR
jgi:archaellum component FlaC